MGYGDLFELLDEFGEEGVGDFGDDEAEEFTFAGDESPGLSVGEVVELGDGFPDAGGEDWIDSGDVVDGARDGRNGDTCSGGDVADVDLGRGGGVGRFVRTFHGQAITLRS